MEVARAKERRSLKYSMLDAVCHSELAAVLLGLNDANEVREKVGAKSPDMVWADWKNSELTICVSLMCSFRRWLLFQGAKASNPRNVTKSVGKV